MFFLKCRSLTLGHTSTLHKFDDDDDPDSTRGGVQELDCDTLPKRLKSQVKEHMIYICSYTWQQMPQDEILALNHGASGVPTGGVK